jgi:hypothetical protein
MKPVTPVAEAILNSLIVALADDCPPCECPAPFEWDEDATAGTVIIFNKNRSACTEFSGGGGSLNSHRGRSNKPLGEGKRALRLIVSYPGMASQQEATVGLVGADWDVSTQRLDQSPPMGLMLSANGNLMLNSELIETEIVFGSGDDVFVYYDKPTGKGWADNQFDLTASDREAGTNPTFTCAPGTDLYAAYGLYCAVGGNPPSVTVDASYSSGSFAAVG